MTIDEAQVEINRLNRQVLAAQMLSMHLVMRIQHDPRFAYFFDPISMSMEILTETHAMLMGIDVQEFRLSFYPKIIFIGGGKP